MFLNSLIFLDQSEDGTSENASISQVTDAKTEGNSNDTVTNEKSPNSKDSIEGSSQNAILKKIGKKIRLRKKKKREAKQKKTENRARKALKTIR